MGRSKVCGDGVTRSGLTWASTLGWFTRRGRVSFICLGIVSAIVAEGKCVAQRREKNDPYWWKTQSARLTVRPHEMATGTQNPKAGEYPLDSAMGALVSVPQQCVGAHRCPLFVALPGLGYGSEEFTRWLRPVTDKYGMILLALTRYDPSAIMDAALKETLRRFAIDPDKIAILGRCASGGGGMRYGIDNLNVFNRIISVSGSDIPIDGMDPKDKTTEFLIDAGVWEYGPHNPAVQGLRRDGHPVTAAVTIRGHEHQMDDYEFVGYWLHESWTKPNPADRTHPRVVDPVPILTGSILAKITAFWNSFLQEPDSIRTTAREAYLREILIPAGGEQPLTGWMVDMPALAAKYPSVAADLKKAGLTGEQEDAYRVAIISATKTDSNTVTANPTSVLAKNAKFLQGYPDELRILRETVLTYP